MKMISQTWDRAGDILGEDGRGIITFVVLGALFLLAVV